METIDSIKTRWSNYKYKNKDIPKTENLSLTKEQQKAMNKIEATINDKIFKEFLLYGVTGSRQNRDIFTTYSEKF